MSSPRSPKVISVTQVELEAVKCLPVRFRQDWPAVFSTNGVEVWLWNRWGNTPYSEREDVRGKSRVVDTVAEEYLSLRIGGGRFFINDTGAFYTPEFLGTKAPDIQIISFEISQ